MENLIGADIYKENKYGEILFFSMHIKMNTKLKYNII